MEEKINLLLPQYQVVMCPRCNEIHFGDAKTSAVRCGICGNLHKTDGKDYIAVAGNITLGLDKGIIGNNIDEGGRVKKVSTFCPDCFITACRKGEFVQKVSTEKETEKDEDVVTCPFMHKIHKDHNKTGDCTACWGEFSSTYSICEGDPKDNESNS